MAGSVSETSSSPKIYATLSRRRKGESGHLWRSFRLALAGENRGFPFPRPAPYVCDDPVTAWDWSLEDATVARAQIAHHDAAVYPPISGEFAGWAGDLGSTARR